MSFADNVISDAAAIITNGEFAEPITIGTSTINAVVSLDPLSANDYDDGQMYKQTAKICTNETDLASISVGTAIVYSGETYTVESVITSNNIHTITATNVERKLATGRNWRINR